MKSMVKAALAAICVLGASGLARAQDDGAAAASSKPSDSAISATSMGSMPSGGRRQAGRPGHPRTGQGGIPADAEVGDLQRLNQLYQGGQ